MTFHISGEIEIDCTRGVIYFHAGNGRTLLRICRLRMPQSYDPELDLLDITHMIGASYGGKP